MMNKFQPSIESFANEKEKKKVRKAERRSTRRMSAKLWGTRGTSPLGNREAQGTDPSYGTQLLSLPCSDSLQPCAAQGRVITCHPITSVPRPAQPLGTAKQPQESLGLESLQMGQHWGEAWGYF